MLFNGPAVLTRDAIGASGAPRQVVTSLAETAAYSFLQHFPLHLQGYRRILEGWSPGTICGDIPDVVFGNKTATTNRALGHGDSEEQMLDAGGVLSQGRFQTISVALENRRGFECTVPFQRE